MIAVAFPGQGSQKVGMVDQLTSEQKQYFSEASSILGFDLLDLCKTGPQEKLSLTQFAQPALLVTSISLWSTIADNYNPSYFLGHSLGEVTALVAAQAISFSDGVRIITKRGELMAASDVSGGMVAIIGLDEDKVEKICANSDLNQKLTLANYNSPGQMVISGPNTALEKAKEQAMLAGAKIVIPLSVSGPFHSELMSPASDLFGKYLDGFTFQAPKIPVISNIDSQPITTAMEIKQELVDQLTKSVRWIDNILQLETLGVTDLYEVGPGTTLIGLTKRITKNIKLHSLDQRGVR